jgi:hypothetical protein
MAERVVDRLEPVEVEEQHRDIGAAANPAERLGHPFGQHRPIGQAGQRVVPGEVGDALLRLAALGDVFVGGDEAAIRQRLFLDGDDAAIGQVDQGIERGAIDRQPGSAGQELVTRQGGCVAGAVGPAAGRC